MARFERKTRPPRFVVKGGRVAFEPGIPGRPGKDGRELGVPSKNLVNTATGLDGYFWDLEGTAPIVLAGGWWASALIPVTAGQTYTSQGIRIISFRDADAKRVPSSLYLNDPTYGVQTFTPPPGTIYIGVSTTIDRKHLAMLEEGATASPYEPFGVTVPGLLVEGQTISGYVGSLVSQSTTGDAGLTVYRNGGDMAIRSAFDSTRDLIQPIGLNTTSGGEPRVQFINSYRNAVTLTPKARSVSEMATASPAGEVGIHVTGDDISPIFVCGSYIGANHGWAAGPRLTMTGHGKTLVDLGSQWSDGTRTYTLLRVVDANTLILGGPYTVSFGQTTVSTVMPSGPLTHVSGATNAATITGTSVLEQIRPVAHSRTVTARLDGMPIRDGYTTGRVLTVSETYTLISYKGLIDYARSHIGTDPFADLTVLPPLARLTYTYRWEGCTCIVGQTVHALEALRGFLHTTQAAALSVNGGALTQFFPGATGTMGGVNLATEWAHSAMTGSVTPGVTQQVVAADPIARTYQWHNKSGARDYGLLIGYLPVMDGKAATRKANGTDAANWDMPLGTKKSYPRLTGTTNIAIGSALSSVAFRRYLSGEDKPVVPISDGHRAWVLIDGATASAGPTPLPELQGNALTVVGSTNVTAGTYITPEGMTWTRPVAGRYIAEAVTDPTV